MTVKTLKLEGADKGMNGLSGVRVSELKNGIRVATDSMPHVSSVMVGVWVAVGARHERADQNGLAHFLEHMSFKGTTTRSAQDIVQQIEDLGGHINAGTGYESTSYYARLLGEDIATGVEIIADVIKNSLFSKEDVDKERLVILQEIARNNDSPDELVFDCFQERAFPSQSLGRSILGTVPLVQGYSSKDFRAFVDGHYLPDRMILAASGDVDHDAFKALVEKFFGDLKGKDASLPEKALYKGGAQWIERPVDQVHVVFGFPAPNRASEERYAARMLASILGGGAASRLFQEIRERHAMVYSISTGIESFQDAGVIMTYAGTSPDLVEKMLVKAGKECRALIDNLSDHEVERSRKQMRAGMKMAMESTVSRAHRLVAQLQIEGRIIPEHEVDARIASVSKKQLQDLARRIFAEPMTLVMIGPDTPKLPVATAAQVLTHAFMHDRMI